jgi:hypothetical protein
MAPSCRSWKFTSRPRLYVVQCSVIDAYLSLLQPRSHSPSRHSHAQSSSSRSPPRMHCFGSQFFNLLCARANEVDARAAGSSGHMREWDQDGGERSAVARGVVRDGGAGMRGGSFRRGNCGRAELPRVHYGAVRRWTKAALPLENADVIFVPINEGNVHWLCGAVHLRKREIILLDRCSTLPPLPPSTPHICDITRVERLRLHTVPSGFTVRMHFSVQYLY